MGILDDQFRNHSRGIWQDVPLDQLKSEQRRIAQQLAIIDGQIAIAQDHRALVEMNLKRALDLARDCQAAYRGAPPLVRRLFNQLFFEKLYVEDETIRSELAPPFNVLLAKDRQDPAVVRPNGGRSPRRTSLNGSDPETEGLRVASVKEPVLVAGAGFAPATSWL